MFRVGTLYKHKNMVDVAFFVLEVIGGNRKGYVLNICWYHTTYNLPMDLVEVITVKHKDVPLYRELAF